MRRALQTAAAIVLGALPTLSPLPVLAAAGRPALLLGGPSLGTLAEPLVSGISPNLHLRQLSATASPKVCFIGDSRMTLLAGNQIAISEGLQEKLRKRLLEDNPGKTFSWGDFSAGGFTWALFNNNGTPGAYPTWWVNHSNTPLSYVQAASCDLVFIALGINDNAYVDLTDVAGIMTTIAGWSKVPDIVIVTNAPSTINQTYSGQGPGQPLYQAAQYGYLQAAALERTLALADGATLGVSGLPHLGLIDVGRFYAQHYLGIDPARQYLQRVITAQSGIALSANTSYYLPLNQGGDIDLDLTFPGQAATLFAGGRTCTIQVGATYNNSTGFVAADAGVLRSSEYHIQPNGSNWFIDYFSGSSKHTGSPGTVGNVAIPTGAGQDISFHVTAQGGHLIVQVNGSTLFDERVAPRYVGPFYPRFGCQNAATVTINAYSVGVPVPMLQVGTDDQLYPAANGATGGASPSHPSSASIALVEDFVLASTNFRASDAGPLSGTTAAIGGGALAAGACASGTATVQGAATSMAVDASPVTYPGDGFSVLGYVSAANTVTVKVCAIVAATPTASTYNVRVRQ